jgi:hypothetical protein
MAKLPKIDETLTALGDFALEAWDSQRRDNINLQLANSTVAMQTMAEFRKSGGSLSVVFWADQVALADNRSLATAGASTGDFEAGFWLRPQSLKALSWAGDPTAFGGSMTLIGDRAGHYSGLVLDPRWALPAAIYAVTARIIVWSAIDPFAPGFFANEVDRYNTFFGNVFKKEESGVRSLRTLSSEQLIEVGSQGVPFSVAHIYGGYDLSGVVPDGDFEKPAEWPAGLPSGGLKHPASTDDLVLFNFVAIRDFYIEQVKIAIGQQELLQFCGSLENLHANLWRRHPQPGRPPRSPETPEE